jgi:hypothetical protein
MIKLAFMAFGGMGTVAKLLTVLALVSSLGIAYGVWHHKIWQRGYDRAIADIAAQDDKAIKRAKSARSFVVDCQSRGLRWDQSTGVCERR